MHLRRAVGLSALFVLGACRSAPSGPKAETTEPHFTVAAGDVHLLARSVGGGPTLVIVNGGPGASHHAVARLESLASPALRVVVYDQRGMGGSSAPSDDKGYSLDRYVADLEALRQSLGPAKIHVLGHSFGGLVAMAYAGAHPDSVESLILVGSRAPDWEDQKIALGSFEQRFAKLLAEKKLPQNPPPAVGDDCREQSSAFLPVLFADPDFKGPSEETKTTACSIHVRNATEELLPGYDLRPKLKAFTGPSLVMIGDADPFGEGMARATVQALAGSRVQYEVLPKCGHFPWIECPDAFRPKIEAFLDKVAGKESSQGKPPKAAPEDSPPSESIATRLAIAGLEVDETKTFLETLQAFAAKGDRAGVCSLVSYPLIAPSLAAKEKIATSASCVAGFDRIFTSKVVDAITKQRFEALFARSEGVMIGTGELWFSGVCSDRECKKKKAIQIITVNG